MRFDAENQLSVAQAFTGSATVTTNSYTMQSVNQDISIGRIMSLLWLPTVSAGAGSTTQFEVITSTDTALTVNVLSIVSASVLAANLTAGQSYELPIPKGSLGNTLSNAPNANAYLGGRVTITGGTTTLTADCYLMPSGDIAKYKSFPKVVDALV